jgi:nucleotide-binding universal stress UspA family protein
MATRALPKEHWQSYCDLISKGLAGKRAHIEVAGLALGDQVAAKWLPLFGITYDAKGDLLEIAMEGFDHLIHKPTEIVIDDGPSGLGRMEIVDSDRRRQIVKLMEPLLLPPPGSSPSADPRPYKHILVAIDESDTSALALREAVRLAKDQNAVLRLVHVVDLTPVYLTVETPYPYVEYQKALEVGGEKILASRAATVREAGIEVDSKLIAITMLGENIYDLIQEQSKQWPADLIVIGTHGRRGFQHARLGSVAEGLMRLATKPVLVIRGAKQED